MELGMQPHLIKRHPFPGPGLGIRILGDITPEKVRILQEADDIYMSLMREWGLYDKIWQAGVILLPIQSVGVMGDERTYENTIAFACRNLDGCHDGRLGTTPIRISCESFQRNHQQGQRRKPRCLRHQFETACNDRVGIIVLISAFKV